MHARLVKSRTSAEQYMTPVSDGGQSLFLEDLKIGQRFLSRKQTLDASDIKKFASEYDPQAFHLNEDTARQTVFGGLAASGWHTAAITMRLLVDSMPIAGGLIGMSGELAWPRATRPGDTLEVESEIQEIVPSRSRADRGNATVRIVTRNQNGETVQTFTCKILLMRRNSGDAAR
jgi:acyl dehydratase